MCSARGAVALLLAIVATAVIGGCPFPLAAGTTAGVEASTSEGVFTIRLNTDAAPQNASAFAQRVAAGFYDGTVIHRVAANKLVEIGGFVRGALIAKPTRDPIANESLNGLLNLRGTVAMARTDDPNSATAQFFVNLVDNAALDPNGETIGYAVFGRVVSGLDVVDRIGAVPIEASGGFEELPVRDVTIRSARRSELAAGEAGVGVTLDTSFGAIVLAIDAEAAPITAANFLQYVDDAFYDNTLFHRVVAGFVVQGGGFTRSLVARPSGVSAANESRNGLRNVRGAVASAFSADFGDETARFIVSVADNPEFDAAGAELGFTVFGEVVSGLDVVDRIAALPAAPRGDLPSAPVADVVIDRMTVIELPAGLEVSPDAAAYVDNATSAVQDVLRQLIALFVQNGVRQVF